MTNSRKRKKLINETDVSFDARFRDYITSLDTNNRSKKTVKYRGVTRQLPRLDIGKGMMCTRAGYTRYLNEIQTFLNMQRFMGRRINTVVYQYYGDTGVGRLMNKPEQIINQNPKFLTHANQPVQMINNNPTGIYYFMIFVMNRSTDSIGHAVSILVDPVPGAPRMWVFDPHGAASTVNLPYTYGKIVREKVVPNIKKMFGGVFNRNNTRTIYYNGPNLQARNDRGVCTTFYISFAENIMNILTGTITLDQLGFILPNVINARKQFLNNPPNPNRNVVVRNSTRKNQALGGNRLRVI